MTDDFPEANRAIPLPCCVEAPASYLPRAQYGLRMLLLPLGIDPRWVDREDFTGQGLYYGLEPDGFLEGVLRLHLSPASIAYFDMATPPPSTPLPNILELCLDTFFHSLVFPNHCNVWFSLPHEIPLRCYDEQALQDHRRDSYSPVLCFVRRANHVDPVSTAQLRRRL